MIFWRKQWNPICGHYFWDNQYGAKMFCQQLGCYVGGVVRPAFPIKGNSISTYPMQQNYSVDSFRLGMCLPEDRWGNCKGNCNDNVVGGSCFRNMNANCSAGEPVGIHISCPCTCTQKSSCNAKLNQSQ